MYTQIKLANITLNRATIDPVRVEYHFRHSGLDPESSNHKQRRALCATGYPPSRV